MGDRDVTNLVRFGDNDSECLPITRCVCGATFPAWEFIIGIYDDEPYGCPKCGRKLYFSVSIRVFEKRDEEAP